IWIEQSFSLQSVTETNPPIWKVGVVPRIGADNHTVITCRRRRTRGSERYDGYLFALLLQIKSNTLKQNHSLPIRWSWQYNAQRLEAANVWFTEVLYPRKTMKIIPTADRPYALIALTKDQNLINTAVLSGKQAALSVRVFTVSEGGAIDEVTTKARCVSAENRILKTSYSCGIFYVDGSEMQGQRDVRVNITYGKLFTYAKITVWYPKLPITVWVSDPLLNRIKDWQRSVWKWLPESRKKKDAKQIRCGNQFQQAELRVLTSFQVRDEQTGEYIYLAGKSQQLFDVTTLAAEQVRSTNPAVVVVKRVGLKIMLNAIKPGTARITVRSNTLNLDYGSSVVTVTDEIVSVSHISIAVVADVKMTMSKLPDKLDQFIITTKLNSVLEHKYQHGSILFQVHYSDDQVVDLADLPSDEFVLNVWSSDTQIIAILHNSNEKLEIVALRDSPRAFIKVQLRSAENCADEDKPPLTYSQAPVDIHFNDVDPMDYEEEDVVSTTGISTVNSKHEGGKWPIQEIVVLMVVLSVIMGIMRAVGPWGRRPLSEGYEKLVLPLITRLSTSSSCGKDENSQEWIWLSKAEVDSYSLNSRYSRQSTVTVPESSSSSMESNGRRNMSYLGSEINIFISPNPSAEIRCNTVNSQQQKQHSKLKSNGGTNCLKPKRNSVFESSSENNLSSSNYEDQRYTEDETIGSLDHRLPLRHGRPQKFWMDQSSNTIRATTSSCMPQNLDGLRESVA
uniref:TMEM132 domain-containing protein n=1 Tax=Syphacia muris TaxID=451379 RepID=A0A0N5AKW2_9BILA